MEPQKLPDSFIEKKIISNMQVGDIKYLSNFAKIVLLEDGFLYIDKGEKVVDIEENGSKTSDEKGSGAVDLLLGDKIWKIEKLSDGIKLYLYEALDKAISIRKNCHSYEECKLGSKISCYCAKAERTKFKFNMYSLKQSGFDTMDQLICVIAYDSPKKALLQDIYQSVHIIKNGGDLGVFSIDQLEAILDFVLQIEEFETAVIIRNYLSSKI